jgi:hypothetical protein
MGVHARGLQAPIGEARFARLAVFPRKRGKRFSYSTVTDLARLRGWSTSVPFSRATW